MANEFVLAPWFSTLRSVNAALLAPVTMADVELRLPVLIAPKRMVTPWPLPMMLI